MSPCRCTWSITLPVSTLDKICDYLASIETNTSGGPHPRRQRFRRPVPGSAPKLTRNPARDQASAAVRDADKTLAAAERGLAALLADPGLTPAAKNARIPGLEKSITRARAAAAAAVTARKPVPAKLPASDINPDAETALLHAGRRGLQMVLRLLAHNAEHWLIWPPQRLPARRRRIPRHHPPDHHPRPGRHHHLRPRRDHRHPRTARLTARRPRPGTAPRRDQRRPARHPRRHPPHQLPDHPAPHFNCHPITAGDLRLYGSPTRVP